MEMNECTLELNEAIYEKQLNEALERIKGGNLDDTCTTPKNGFLPIHLACLRKDVPLSIVKALVNAEPDSLKVRSFTKDMALPIHFAAGCGASLQVIQLLVKAFPDSIYAINVNGLLPLHSACWSTNTSFDVVRFLIESFPGGLQALTHTCANTPLHAAACTDAPTDVIRLLVRSYPDGLFAVNGAGHTPMMLAEEKRHDRVVQVLTEEESKVGRKKNVDTHEVKEGTPKIVNIGLSGTIGKDGDVNSSAQTDSYDSAAWSVPVFQPRTSDATFHTALNTKQGVTSFNSSSKSHRNGIFVTLPSNKSQEDSSNDSSNDYRNAAINNGFDAMPFVSPERTGAHNFRAHQPISPFAGSTTNILRNEMVGAQTKSVASRTVESIYNFGDTGSVETGTTSGRTYRSSRANSFLQELEQSEEFWGIQRDSSKTVPSAIERICQLEERVFGKATNGPLLKRHRDLFYFGCDGESFAEWIDQLEEMFLGNAFASEENNAVARIEWLETLFFGASKTGDMRIRLKELDAVSRF